MPVKWDDRKYRQRFEAAAVVGMHATTADVVGQIKVTLDTENRDGRNPSKPGDPPHRVSGTLQKSVTKVVESHPGEITGMVGTNVEYAKELEFGTPTKAARPWLRDGIRDNATRMNKVFTRTVRRIMR